MQSNTLWMMFVAALVCFVATASLTDKISEAAHSAAAHIRSGPESVKESAEAAKAKVADNADSAWNKIESLLGVTKDKAADAVDTVKAAANDAEAKMEARAASLAGESTVLRNFELKKMRAGAAADDAVAQALHLSSLINEQILRTRDQLSIAAQQQLSGTERVRFAVERLATHTRQAVGMAQDKVHHSLHSMAEAGVDAVDRLTGHPHVEHEVDTASTTATTTATTTTQLEEVDEKVLKIRAKAALEADRALGRALRLQSQAADALLDAQEKVEVVRRQNVAGKWKSIKQALAAFRESVKDHFSSDSSSEKSPSLLDSLKDKAAETIQSVTDTAKGLKDGL